MIHNRPVRTDNANSTSNRFKGFSRLAIAGMILLAIGIASASAAILPSEIFAGLTGSISTAVAKYFSPQTAEPAAPLFATTTVSCPTTSNASPTAANDARVCINSYITAATAGDILEIPAGDYQIQGTIVVNKGITLRGANYGVKATGSARSSGETKFTKVTNGSYGIAVVMMSIESDDVTVDGFEFGDTSTFGIAMQGFSVAGAVRQNVQILNNWMHLDGATSSSGAVLLGLNTTAAGTYKNVSIKGNYITRSAHNPIRISGSNTSLENFEVSNNYLSAAAASALQHWGAGSGYVVNTFKFQNNVVVGGSVTIASVSTGTINGNVFKASATRSSNLNIGIDGGTVSENTFQNNGANTAYIFFMGNNAAMYLNQRPSKNVTMKNNLFNEGSFIDASDSGGIDLTTFYLEKNRFVPSANATDCGLAVTSANLLIKGPGGVTIPSNLNYWGQSSGVDVTRLCGVGVTEGSWISGYSDDSSKFGTNATYDNGVGDDSPGFWPLIATSATITSDLSTATDVYRSYTVTGKVNVTGIGGDDSFISGDIPGQVVVSDGDDTCTDSTVTAVSATEYDFSCSLTSNKAGSKTVVATYTDTRTGSNKYWATSSSSGTAHMVNKLALTITATTDSKTFDNSKTSSATPTYSALGRGADSFTSLVQEFDSVDAGTRTLSIKTYTISDGNGGGNYEVATQTASGSITAADTTTSISNSVATTIDYGTSVTLTATVSESVTGVYAEGTVTFKDGSTTVGTCVLSAGTCDSAAIVLSAGSRSLTAVYGGENNFNGSTSSAFTQEVNAYPVADAQSVSTDEDNAKIITLSGSDAEDSALSFTIVSGPSHGTLGSVGAVSCATLSTSCFADVTYTPTANYHGSDSFTFKVNDGRVDSPTSTVSITVDSVNDDSVATDTAGLAVHNGSGTFTLSASDIDGDALTFLIASGPAHGTLGSISAVTCSGATPNVCSATVSYSSTGYSGYDSFTYKANDGTSDSNAANALVTVPAVNQEISGTVGVDNDGSASTGATGYGPTRVSRYVGKPAPSGFAHIYQWANPANAVYPENAPVVIRGQLDVSSQQTNSVALIGLLDRDHIKTNAGYQSGAYIYLYKNGSTVYRVGVSDGNYGGDVAQTYQDIPQSAVVAAGNKIDFVFTVDGTADGSTCVSPNPGTVPASSTAAGCLYLDITVGGTSYSRVTDNYGQIKVRYNSGTPIETVYSDHVEFGNGAVFGWDNSPSSNLNNAKYDLVVDSDQTAPTLSNTSVTPATIVDGDSVSISAQASASNSGEVVKSVEYSIDGGSWTAMTEDSGTYSANPTIDVAAPKTVSVCIRATDGLSGTTFSDDTSGAAANCYDVKVKATTTTSLALTAGTSPSTYGDSLTFTATVSPSAATGTVTIKDGTTTLGTCTLSSGSCTYTTSALNVATHSITAEYGGDIDYDESTSSSVSQTVNKKQLSVNAVAKSKTYGAGDPTFTYTYSGFITGESASNVTIAGAADCTRASGETVAGSPYTITCAAGTLSADNYSFATGTTADLTITKKELSVNAVADSKTYGDADPTFNYALTGFANSEDATSGGVTGSASCSRTEGEDVAGSPYTITCTPGTLSAGNYSFATGSTADFNINKKALSVNAEAKSKTYGESDPTFTYSFSGFVGEEDETSVTIGGAASCSRTTGETVAASPYTITCAAGTLSAGNYSFTTGSTADFTIAKKELLVNAVAKSKVYGGSDPTFTYTYSGFITGENAGNVTVSGSASCSREEGESVAAYAITCTAGDLSAANYSFATGSTADLTITKKQLSVNAEAKSKTYGDSDPTFTYTYSGFITGENAGSVTITGSASCSRILGDNAGTYAITCAPGTLSAGNYSFTTGSTANLTINKADTATSLTCASGPFTYDGTPKTPCSVTTTGVAGAVLSSSVTYTNNVNAGTATATATFAATTNYNASSDTKTFTIDKADTTTAVTCPASVTYTGSAITPCSARVTGVASLNQSVTVTYSNNVNVGTATATANYGGAANYNSSSSSTTFAINQAASSMLYNGLTYYAAGTTSITLSAQLSGPCAVNSPVVFAYDSNGDGTYETNITSVNTNSSGVATYTWAGISPGIFDVEARFAGSGNCSSSYDVASIVVAGTGDSSNGGGWYTVNGAGKVNFGYQAQVKTVKTSTGTTTTVTGNMTWNAKGYQRIKGSINAYTKVTCPTQSPSLTGTVCGYLSGSGSLYTWNSTYLRWDLTSTNVAFQVTVADGGTTSSKKGGTVTNPDYFKMNLPTVTVVGEDLILNVLKGGNLVVK